MTGSFSPYIYIVLPIVGALILGVTILALLRRRSRAAMYLQDPLFDGPTRSFYSLLDVAVRDHFNLFRNIPVSELLRSSGTVSPLPGSIRDAAFDLVLCDRRKMLPKCAIVLVDRKNPREKQTACLREYCDKVGLTMLVYEMGGMLDVTRLRQDVMQATEVEMSPDNWAIAGEGQKEAETDELLQTAAVSNTVLDTAPEQPLSEQDAALNETDETPSLSEEERHICRKCGAAMQLRTISKGSHAGQQAWVCETFPACRHATLLETVG